MNLKNVFLAFNKMVIYLENYLDFSLDGQHSVAPKFSFNDVFTTICTARIWCVLLVVLREKSGRGRKT